MTAKPSDNWINEVAIVDPFGKHIARSEHAARCSEARREVRQARQRLHNAKTLEERNTDRIALCIAASALVDLEYNQNPTKEITP